MSWKPHWCAAAQKLAAEHGLTIGEIDGGRLAFITAGNFGDRDAAIDFTKAHQHAAAADEAAAAAIQAAFAVAKGGA